MKKVFLLLLIFGMICSVRAIAEGQAVAQGFVYITIINNPPKITDISFSPETAYSDSVVKCIPQVIDEVPAEVEFNYRWYRNGNLLEIQTNEIQGSSENDLITCEAVPIDCASQKGAAFSKTIRIEKTPTIARAELFALNTAGIRTSTQKILELNQQGLGSITGYVVAEIGSTGQEVSYLGLLVALIVLIILVNINLVIRYVIKRRDTLRI